MQLVIGVADLHITAGDLRGHVDAGQIDRGLSDLRIGLSGFGATLQLAEQIELIRHPELAIGQVEHRQLFLLQERLGRHLRAADAGLHFVIEAARVQRLFVHRGGAAQVGTGDLQLDVVAQGLFDQAIQHRVLIQRPPACRQRCAGLHLVVAGVAKRGIGGRALVGRLRRHRVVRADRGAGAQCGQQRGQSQGTQYGAVHGAALACTRAGAVAASRTASGRMVTVAVRPAISCTRAGT